MDKDDKTAAFLAAFSIPGCLASFAVFIVAFLVLASFINSSAAFALAAIITVAAWGLMAVLLNRSTDG